jgi:hypothetical protein
LMDVSQVQALVETSLAPVFSQGTVGIEQLKAILEMIISATNAIWAIAILISQWPELIELANQLLVVISAGGTVHEIAVFIANFTSAMGLSIEAVVQLLQVIGGMLVIF